MRKALMIPDSLHQQLKIRAAKENKSLMKLLIEIITQYLSISCLLLLLVSCSTNYVALDKINMKRFQHDQKVVLGMTKAEALERFQSPDEAFNDVFAGEVVEVWRFHHKIFCSHDGTRCDLYFKNSEVIYYNNFRMEFTDVVAGGR